MGKITEFLFGQSFYYEELYHNQLAENQKLKEDNAKISVFLTAECRVNQRRLLLTGIIQDKDPCVCGVYLGGCYFTFSELFQKFDVRFGKEDWQPFGVYE